jgi:Mn2+/Fe2+ NRAMP family transporter
LGSNTGYGLIVADTYERFVQRHTGMEDGSIRDAVRGRAYRVVLTLFCVPPLYVLFTSWKPVWVLIVTSAMFLVLTPIMMAGLLLMTENRVLMGNRVNGWVSRTAIAAAILVTLYLTYESAVELAGRL